MRYQDKISERVKQIPPSGIRRFFELVIGVKDVLSLAVGEPDFITPWRIREAGISSLEMGYTSYTSNWGLMELRNAISDKIMEMHGISYDPRTQVLITCGVSEALDLAMRAILNPGDEVIVFEPCYVSYVPAVVFAGGVPRIVETSERRGFLPSIDQIESKISRRTKAILINYPNNPTGVVMDRKRLEEIADLAMRYDLLVISDEIYWRLTYGAKHTCFASLAEDRTILLDGFSKAYAMTGWRLGFACAPEQIAEAMMKIHQYTMLCAPITSQLAAIEALKCDELVEEMRAEYDRRRKFLISGLKKIGMRCVEPRGAFYAFPSIRQFGMSSEEFASELLRREKVALVPGNAFGNAGEGYVRISYAASMETIQEALRRMENFISSIS